jgi:hypothetical protein
MLTKLGRVGARTHFTASTQRTSASKGATQWIRLFTEWKPAIRSMLGKVGASTPPYELLGRLR